MTVLSFLCGQEILEKLTNSNSVNHTQKTIIFIKYASVLIIKHISVLFYHPEINLMLPHEVGSNDVVT